VTRRYALTEVQLRSKKCTVKIVISHVTAESGLRNSIYFENGLRGERAVVKRNGITGLIQLK
jgi:hypothetical protein